uniref:Uncharacterized protein n=1 Tax=Megaselia scalaris TaxID=36166 RepID=T1GLC1_MEGSC
MGIHLNPFEMPRLNIINDDQDRHSSTYSFDNDETNFDEFITQQFNLITDDEINVVEGLPPLVVQETTSASSVQQSTRNLLSTGVELLSNSRASEASDL